MHHLDELITTQWPTVIAPKYGSLAPMTSAGDRFLVTSHGLRMQIKRSWIEAVIPMQTGRLIRPIPYGPGPDAGVTLLCGKAPTMLLERFTHEARACLPNEHAAWFVWNEQKRTWRYQPVKVLEHSPSRITYERPTLAPEEHLVVDVHSHGLSEAFLSSVDEADDRGTLQVSLVVGSLGDSEPTYKAVVRCLGFTQPMGIDQFVGGPHA